MRGRKKEIDQKHVLADLYEVYEQPMYRIAYAILHDAYQAEDAVHEAFIKMVRYLPQCEDIKGSQTKALIVRCLKSSAIDIYRKNQRESGHVPLEENAWIEDNHNVIESYLNKLSCGEQLKIIREKLPEIYLSVIQMHYYYGMPVTDIGKNLGISTENVYQRLTRARKMVRDLIGDEAV